MSLFSSWILSIAGIAIMGALFDMLLPEGQMQKYVKVVYSFIVVLVIISPFPKLLNSSVDMEEFFGAKNALTIQTQFIGVVNMQKKLLVEKNIVTALKIQGIDGADIEVNVDLLSNDFKILSVTANLGQVVIKETEENIDMIALVKLTIENIAGVKEDLIIINE